MPASASEQDDAMVDWHDVGEATPGTAPRTVLVAGRMVLLAHFNGHWHATDGVCPHKFANLEEGTFGDGCVTCPQHEATFDLHTGRPGEGEGWAGQLSVHAVRERSGRLEVQLNSA